MSLNQTLKVMPFILGLSVGISGCTHAPVFSPYEKPAEIAIPDTKPVFDTQNIKARKDDRWYDAKIASKQFGTATGENLRQQAANEQDLSHPRQLGAPNPQAAVGAVQRYQQGAVRALGEVSLEAGGSSD